MRRLERFSLPELLAVAVAGLVAVGALSASVLVDAETAPTSATAPAALTGPVGPGDAAGTDAEEDDAAEQLGGDAGNILLHLPARGGSEAKYLLSAHLDTVETGERPVKPKVDGDWIRSDGQTILGADDKSGVAILLELARRLKESRGRHAEILFALTVGEERECSGAAVLDAQRAGSGIWYAGGGYTLRGKGDEADFTRPGEAETHCTAR